MKKIFITICLLAIYTNCTSQTKVEKYKHLNEKIDIYKLNDPKKNYNYLFHEVVIKEKKVIKFIQFCTAFKLCSRAYYLDTNEYAKIVVIDKAMSKSLEIYFKPNSINTQKINIKTEEHFKGDLATKFTISLNKDTPNSEVNNIKEALVALLKEYGIKKKKTLD